VQTAYCQHYLLLTTYFVTIYNPGYIRKLSDIKHFGNQYFYVSRFGWLFLLIVCGCAAPIPLPRDYSTQKSILLPFKVDAVVIKDLRADTTNAKMDLPVLVAKSSEWIKSPPLSGDVRSEIKEMIYTSSYSNGVPADVTVSITKGYYRIYGNAWEVGEYTFFECRINYLSKESGESWAVISNSFNDYSGVFNATEKHVSESYKITVRNAVFKALKESERIFSQE